MKTTSEILKKIPAFSTLSNENLEKIKDITLERNFRKGTIVFMEGDPGEAFYFIKSGKIKVFKTTADGRELIFAILGDGDVFAEVTLFNDMNYPASAEVLEDASIGMISNKALEDLVVKNSNIALGIIKVLSKKLFNSQQKVKELALGDTYMRTAQMIIKLSDEHGVSTEGGIELKLSISRQELANMIGTARETVSRALGQFKKEGSIDISGKKIIVKDINKLKDWIQ
ncbi:Crp/Fnr family transcriptional regulator [Alkaliphilus peptidifermentans]|uniref:Transcriptional regulator, Crp/Fnr family n=1 Tax=Alkaliphilus peptidifermentans DSM 18978 TaxID=1120976 RepID=A0A1G5HU45_9FIRM|nr:Crp/Fnr family transcriptional regulator [Alkaliphilus peptidifermentans]SCY67385.1 transcriptional regulator, Crp/Fnr family [Alkaliphilus peptidifermentans DSM 18978]